MSNKILNQGDKKKNKKTLINVFCNCKAKLMMVFIKKKKYYAVKCKQRETTRTFDDTIYYTERRFKPY